MIIFATRNINCLPCNEAHVIMFAVCMTNCLDMTEPEPGCQVTRAGARGAGHGSPTHTHTESTGVLLSTVILVIT